MNDHVSKVGVVAFGFGEPATLDVNKKLAAKATAIATTSGALMICTDRDVSPHFKDMSIPVTEIDPTRKPTTYRLAVLVAAETKSAELEALHIIAAPCHMWRCRRDIAWALKEVGSTADIVLEPVADYPYDFAATTFYTRSAWLWWPLEISYRAWSSLVPVLYKRLRY